VVASGREREEPRFGVMKVSIIFFVVVLLAIVGGLVFLSTWEIPPPAEQVEKVIPNEKLSR